MLFSTRKVSCGEGLLGRVLCWKRRTLTLVRLRLVFARRRKSQMLACFTRERAPPSFDRMKFTVPGASPGTRATPSISHDSQQPSTLTSAFVTSLDQIHLKTLSLNRELTVDGSKCSRSPRLGQHSAFPAECPPQRLLASSQNWSPVFQ